MTAQPQSRFSIAVAVVAGLIGLLMIEHFVRWSIVYLRAGDEGNAFAAQLAVVLAIGPTVFFLLPPAQRAVLAWSLRSYRRVIFAVVALVWLAALVLFLSSVLLSEDSRFYGTVPESTTLIGMLVFLICYIVAFVLPGLAFRGVIPREKRPKGRGYTLEELQSIYGRSGVSPGERYVMYVLAIPIGFISLSVLMLQDFVLFLPSPEMVVWYERYRAVLMALVFLMSMPIVWTLYPRRPAKWKPRPNLLKATAYFLVLVTLLMFSESAMLRVAPSFIGKTEATASRLEVRVQERKDGYDRANCNYSATISFESNPRVTTLLCGLPREIWRELVPGQILLVDGAQNPFGLKLAADGSSVRLAQQQP